MTGKLSTGEGSIVGTTFDALDADGWYVGKVVDERPGAYKIDIRPEDEPIWIPDDCLKQDPNGTIHLIV